MTGRGAGFCVLRIGGGDSGEVSGYAGRDGKRVELTTNEGSAFVPLGRHYGGCFAKEVSQMPGGDGTGPMGMGAMTGRAAGYCAGSGVPGYVNPGPGRGFWGRGRGGGRGRRNWFHATGMPGWARVGAGLPAWGGYPPYSATPQAAQAGGQAAPTAEQELDVLKGQAEYFGGALEDINKRIGELESGKKAE